MSSNDRARCRGALLGLAAGDAVGTTVEFRPRGTFAPLTGMVGGGPFNLRAGEWTDDTSMALCLARSLLDSRGFDAADQMRRYVQWRQEGYLSSNGRFFDIGGTVSSALRRFESSGEPFAGSTDPDDAGNGSLMRLAPVVLYFRRDPENAIRQAGESSRTTHGAPEAVDACRLYAALLLRALSGETREEILRPVPPETFDSHLSPAIAALAAGSGRDKTADEICGNGYVLRSLEAALWCFARTDSFESAILLAANLGDDADTTAAIVGQLAGAHYGEEGIPPDWRHLLARGGEIRGLADALADAWPLQPSPFAQAYWANPAGVLAGPYPGDLDPHKATAKIRSLLEAGVRRIVNLMEAEETNAAKQRFTPYESLVRDEASRIGVDVECRRFEIPDLGIPSRETQMAIQDVLDASLAGDEPVYVHCWGGVGRTGTAVALHLIRHGQAEPTDFEAVIQSRRRGGADDRASPENREQCEHVRALCGA